MAIDPLHTFLGTLAAVIGAITLGWVSSSLKDEKSSKFKIFLRYFIFGVFGLLLSNIAHIYREMFSFGLGDYEKLPEFAFLLLGYLILILGVKKISSLKASRGVA